MCAEVGRHEGAPWLGCHVGCLVDVEEQQSEAGKVSLCIVEPHVAFLPILVIYSLLTLISWISHLAFST